MTDERIDIDLREAIDAVADPALHKALVLMQRRTRAYAIQNRSRINLHGRILIGLGVIIAVILAGVGTWDLILNSQTKDLARKNKDAIVQINDSRRSGLRISCGFDSAVIEAGRVTITSGQSGLPRELRLFLEAHGLPSITMQKKAAQQAAVQYAKSIAEQIVKTAGAKGSGIIRLDGSVNCKKFEQAVLGAG